ncbi:septal ring lytic transglycosylase RlpA family protein [Mesohalobacter halotolerans]|uniref:Septal ring lytic transglycosylase RlpA family protein n=1 Tax=Mesohalobacter halotolerans TaxID=1883405 RepID=A0A4V6ALG5_9FLAO|nr:SPOR domain-containing protein [Mesohalobacter halotolerans]MBS3738013.1 septal ring lytic transglycosylase RlpA family protein [Psychroflexus sp.]TKS56715.1 septal ring lytic transglycosylase RlpA family protein [Mesohalobacter halotolerans]
MNFRTLFVFLLFFCFTSLNAQIQQGLASIRPLAHEGLLTKSGERFSHDSLVASHRSLPFGSVIKVTNLKTRESINVRINDRGPFIKGRIIDLSQSAGDSINLYLNDITQVKLSVLKLEKNFKPKTNDFKGNYTIQVASYSEKENAINYSTELLKYNLREPVKIKAQKFEEKSLFKVFIGTFETREEAEKYKRQLPKALQNSFITDIEP